MNSPFPIPDDDIGRAIASLAQNLGSVISQNDLDRQRKAQLARENTRQDTQDQMSAQSHGLAVADELGGLQHKYGYVLGKDAQFGPRLAQPGSQDVAATPAMSPNLDALATNLGKAIAPPPAMAPEPANTGLTVPGLGPLYKQPGASGSDEMMTALKAAGLTPPQMALASVHPESIDTFVKLNSGIDVPYADKLKLDNLAHQAQLPDWVEQTTAKIAGGHLGVAQGELAVNQNRYKMEAGKEGRVRAVASAQGDAAQAMAGGKSAGDIHIQLVQKYPDLTGGELNNAIQNAAKEAQGLEQGAANLTKDYQSTHGLLTHIPGASNAQVAPQGFTPKTYQQRATELAASGMSHDAIVTQMKQEGFVAQ